MGAARSSFEAQLCTFSRLNIIRDVQMIPISYFDTFYGFRLGKNIRKQGVEVIPSSTN